MNNNPTLTELYLKGLTYSEIADRTGLSAAEVQRRVRAGKMQPKKEDPLLNAEDLQSLRDDIRKLRAQGLTMKAIGRQVGLDHLAVYAHLRAIGLE